MPCRVMVLDAAPAAVEARVAAVLLDEHDGKSLSLRHAPGHDGIGIMPSMLEECLAESEWQAPDLVVVVVGPGSFTGLRTSCSLAAGLAFGFGCPVVGVTRGEALSPVLDTLVRQEERTGWLCVTTARRGRWFVESPAPDPTTLGPVIAVKSAEWEPPTGSWIVAGDGAEQAVACAPDRLFLVTVTGEASPEDIAHVGLLRHQGRLAARPPLPLYVDPPEAKLPAAGLRARPE